MPLKNILDLIAELFGSLAEFEYPSNNRNPFKYFKMLMIKTKGDGDIREKNITFERSLDVDV